MFAEQVEDGAVHCANLGSCFFFATTECIACIAIHPFFPNLGGGALSPSHKTAVGHHGPGRAVEIINGSALHNLKYKLSSVNFGVTSASSIWREESLTLICEIYQNLTLLCFHRQFAKYKSPI